MKKLIFLIEGILSGDTLGRFAVSAMDAAQNCEMCAKHTQSSADLIRYNDTCREDSLNESNT